MQAGLFGAAVSVVMNFVSWNKAYSLFPGMTFVERRMWSLEHHLEHHPDAMLEKGTSAVARYELRGWKLANWDSEFEVLRLQSARPVGDSKSWVIPFDSDASTDSSVEDIWFRVGGEVRPVVVLERW